jgi:DNA repair protein RadC
MAAIKTLDEKERPREKLSTKGCSHLSNAELLAIIINSGNREKSAVELAQEILLSADQNLIMLSTKSVDFFKNNFQGIGEAKAVSIVAAMELGRRRNEATQPVRPQIKTSLDAFLYISTELCDLQHEEMWAVFLNNAGRTLSKQKISEGGISKTMIDIRKLLKKAVETGATGIILAHNHPSGNVSPSKEDIALTDKIKIAAKTLDIKLCDHLIISGNDYFSFADEEMIEGL